MAGNSQRKGATRNSSSKKARAVGSGGQRRKGLEGKGPTPKAKDRTGHPAARAASRQSGGRQQVARSAVRARPTGEHIAGRNAVVEALRAGIPATSLLVAEGTQRDQRVREALTLAQDADVTIAFAPRDELDRRSRQAVHQGVLLSVPPYGYVDLDEVLATAPQQLLLVALDGVTDPRNLGAIVRSAGAFGAHGVVIPERRCASMTAAAWKASAGVAAQVRVSKVTNLTRELRRLSGDGVTIVGLEAGASADVAAFDESSEPLVLVVGGESSGLSRLVREACDVLVSIGMSSGVQSLNAAVAAGIALHAINVQRSGD